MDVEFLSHTSIDMRMMYASWSGVRSHCAFWDPHNWPPSTDDGAHAETPNLLVTCKIRRTRCGGPCLPYICTPHLVSVQSGVCRAHLRPDRLRAFAMLPTSEGITEILDQTQAQAQAQTQALKLGPVELMLP